MSKQNGFMYAIVDEDGEFRSLSSFPPSNPGLCSDAAPVSIEDVPGGFFLFSAERAHDWADADDRVVRLAVVQPGAVEPGIVEPG